MRGLSENTPHLGVVTIALAGDPVSSPPYSSLSIVHYYPVFGGLWRPELSSLYFSGSLFLWLHIDSFLSRPSPAFFSFSNRVICCVDAPYCCVGPVWVAAWCVVVWNSLWVSALTVIRQASPIEKKKWKEIMLASDG